MSLGDSSVSPGEMDLAKMLASIKIERRDELVTMVSLPEPVALGHGVHAVLTEVEGTTVIATLGEAERRGWPANFVAVWLTVQVHSSLEAVGLTAAMSRALTERQIPCNVLAGITTTCLCQWTERTKRSQPSSRSPNWPTDLWPCLPPLQTHHHR